MILFHGSNTVVESPNADYGDANKGKDFGLGFYLTADKRMAKNFAETVTMRKKEGHPIVSKFEVRADCLKTCNLAIKVFEKADAEWFEFVADNRLNPIAKNKYDLIIGPVADKGLQEKLNEYTRMVHSGESINLKEFAQSVEFSRFNNSAQYCFTSSNSLKFLKYII